MIRARSIFVIAASLAAAACASVLGIDGDYHPLGADAGTRDGNAADDGGTDAGGPTCDASLVDDPLNCGACGRSCVGAACANGRCAPANVTNDAVPSALAVDNDAIYWTETGDGGVGGGAVVKCSKAACTDRTVLAPMTRPVAIDAMKDDVFVLASKDLAGGLDPHGWAIAKAGGTPSECQKNGSPATPSSMIADGDHVFVAQTDQLVRCDDGCGVTPCVKVSGEHSTTILAENGDRLFWLGTDTGKQGLRRCTLAGNTCTADSMTNMAVVASEVAGLAADEAKVFVATSSKLVAVDRTTSDLTPLADVGLRSGLRLLQGGSAVYVATDHALVRVPKGGGAALTLVDVEGTTAVALDESYVYYGGGASGGIFRVAR